MTLTLYYNSSESNRVTKTLNKLDELAGNLRGSCSVTNPVFIVTEISEQSIARMNYVYVAEFERYYFINDVVSLREGLWEIRCHVDVLTTWKTAIKRQRAIISRQEQKYNMYLDDPEFKAYTYRNIQTLRFPLPVNKPGDMQYILITAGGG